MNRATRATSGAIGEGLVGIVAGVGTYFAASLVSAWAYNPPGDPAPASIAALLVAAAVVGAAFLRPRVALVGGVTMLALLFLGFVVGASSSLVMTPGLDFAALLKHGGRSAVVAALTGAVLVVSLLSLREQRLRSTSDVGDASEVLAQR
ncbi:hypothetical protein [Agrococcus sp. Marseille-Q4369]|uniref:hypothetical protein n=1 Tax=Agrococcus sp. Marseille-Q4369 TaxID=2810513 RepID=UPI001B8B40EA|nr:hypothetical protein [Agrococcus sp. Marseille-Q4369]QUW18642.1 hypothetical protein JSQ78_12765 [Agrococcus sp. Marseille-Q4369]